MLRRRMGASWILELGTGGTCYCMRLGSHVTVPGTKHTNSTKAHINQNSGMETLAIQVISRLVKP